MEAAEEAPSNALRDVSMICVILLSIRIWPTQDLGRDITLIAVRDGDKIDVIQAEAALVRHKIRCVPSGDHMFGSTAIYAYCPPKQATQILAREAPRGQYSLYITGYRDFGDQLAWSKAKSVGALEKLYPALEPTKALAKLSVTVTPVTLLEYKVRKYIGLDQKRHVGLEVRFPDAPKSMSYQIL